MLFPVQGNKCLEGGDQVILISAPLAILGTVSHSIDPYSVQYLKKKKIKITKPPKGTRLAKIWRYIYLKECVSQDGFDSMQQKRQLKFVSMIFRNGSQRASGLEVAGSRSFNSVTQQHHQGPRLCLFLFAFLSASALVVTGWLRNSRYRMLTQ